MKKAFTLAETLITLAIVGVISVIMINNISNETSEAEMLLKFKKTITAVEDAYNAAWVEGGLAETFVSDRPTPEQIFAKMKLAKNCGTGSGCWYASGGGSKAPTNINDNTHYYKAILSHGSSVAIAEDLYTFYIDVDGPYKGKNKMNYDTFTLWLYNGTVVFGEYDSVSTLAVTTNSINNDYFGAAWFFIKGNRDYLKLNSSNVCKNNTSKSLSWSDPNKSSCD